MKQQLSILIAFLVSFPILAQSNKFVGRVSIENEITPAVGVTVIVKGNKKQTLITSENGMFIIENLKFPAKVIFKNTKFERKMYSIESMADSLFILQYKTDTDNKLEAKKAQTGTIDEVVLTDSDVYFPSLIQRLKTVPGVAFIKGKMIIRGRHSINNQIDPLIIVDGQRFHGTIHELNISPSTIKSISVLKGAETSIYGSAGIAGVLLITTGK